MNKFLSSHWPDPWWLTFRYFTFATSAATLILVLFVFYVHKPWMNMLKGSIVLNIIGYIFLVGRGIQLRYRGI